MTRRYLRNVQVVIGDQDLALRVKNLLIKFDLQKEAQQTPAAGHISIYNLNQTNEALVRDRGVRCQLFAGYGSDQNLRLVIDGEVRRVNRMREGLDRITKIAVGGKVEQRNAPLFIHTYSEVEKTRDVVRDIVNAMPGLSLGSLEAIPADAMTEPYSWDLKADYALRNVLIPLDIEHFEENGIIQFSKRGETSDDSNDGAGFTISQRSGMIGTPTILEDSGIKVRTMLDARLLLNSRVRVLSSSLGSGAFGSSVSQRAQEAAGSHKITVIRHAGDSRGGEFYTEFEARAL